jgi:hypothetical protein
MLGFSERGPFSGSFLTARIAEDEGRAKARALASAARQSSAPFGAGPRRMAIAFIK